MKLSKQQAQNLSNIMGYKYSHHDEDVCYTDYGDVNPMIYFYQGMSPFTFKLDTVTGSVSDMTSKYADMMKSIIEGFRKKEVALHEENVKLIEKWEKDYADWDEKQKRVIEYLKSEDLLKLSI